MLDDGNITTAFVIHAVDAIVTDGTRVVLIRRAKDPRKGMLALPGGFLDADETPEQAALRELKEETGLTLENVRVRHRERVYDRPHDIRFCEGIGLHKYGIVIGDVFLVTTQYITFAVPNLITVRPQAGDDAASVEIVRINALTPDSFAFSDHYDAIMS